MRAAKSGSSLRGDQASLARSKNPEAQARPALISEELGVARQAQEYFVHRGRRHADVAEVVERQTPQFGRGG